LYLKPNYIAWVKIHVSGNTLISYSLLAQSIVIMAIGKYDPFILETHTGQIDLHTPKIMGILNLTADSFYAGNRFLNKNNLLEVVKQMVDDGANIIDLGAVSTRPGSKAVSEQEELNRLIEPLEIIRKNFAEIFISVDTFRSRVAKIAVDGGADIINDISGGTMDKDMFEQMTSLGVPYILMHMQGRPETMQKNPVYNDVVKEVRDFLLQQSEKLRAAGFQGSIVLDPGFGFGKNPDHNFQLLSNLKTLLDSGFPILAGVSRKSMINRLLKTKPDDALNGTTVLNTLALLNGANILRVHDVKEAKQAIILVEYYKQFN